MAERVHTGGRKEFKYSGNEKFEHTKETGEFTRAYHEWSNRPFYKRKKFWKVAGLIILVLAIVVVLRYFLGW